MSYDTRHRLNWNDGPSREEVIEAIARVSGDPDTQYWDGVTSGDSAVSWYDHETNVARMSEQFPGTVFTLEGEGESGPNEDMWKKYFRNGLVQRAPAAITYPEFDESLLAEPGREEWTGPQPRKSRERGSR